MDKKRSLICGILLFGLTGISSGDVPSVVIIGGGPAGLAAAARLLENNIFNIKVLEAENRIGGRVQSVKVGSNFLDLGAENCHGEKDNVVYEKVRDLDVLDPYDVPFSTVYFSCSKLDKQFALKLLEVSYGLLQESLQKGGRNVSIGDYCKRK